MHVPKPRCYVIEFNKTFFTICGFVPRDIPLTTQTINFSGATPYTCMRPGSRLSLMPTWEFRLLTHPPLTALATRPLFFGMRWDLNPRFFHFQEWSMIKSTLKVLPSFTYLKLYFFIYYINIIAYFLEFVNKFVH